MEENIKYEQALAQLETIVRKMEANEYDIDELAAQLKTARRTRCAVENRAAIDCVLQGQTDQDRSRTPENSAVRRKDRLKQNGTEDPCRSSARSWVNTCRRGSVDASLT